jgi:hypothetical protein
VTHRLFVLDIPENTGVTAVGARAAAVTVRRIGPYVVLESDEPIVIDRRATGCRHAVWYSCVSALSGGRITQWDKNTLKVESR